MPDNIELITIPITLPSRNKLDKMHWSKRHRLGKTYCLLIRNQMRLNNIPKTKPETMYGINIMVSRRYRIRDYDNLVGGCKQLLDALTKEGFIYDDDTCYIGIPNISQCKSKEDSITISRRPIK